MGTLYVAGSLTNGTGELQAMDYTNDIANVVTAIGNLTTAVNALTTALNNAIGVESIGNQYSLGNSQIQMASNISGLLDIAINGNKKQGDALGALSSIQKSLNGIASSMNTSTAISVIQANDQMKKNAFDKEATQQALARNNLPAVTVSNDAFLQTVETNITEGARIFTTASSVGLVNGVLSTSATNVANFAYDLLPSGAEITNSFKTFFKSRAADPEGEAARTQAQIKNI